MCEIDWPAVAAWVQAIGSIAAIIAAIWIGERSSSRSRDLVEQERKRQADIFASTFSMRLGLQAQEAEHKAQFASQLAKSSPGSHPMDQTALQNLFLLSHADRLIEERRDCLLFDRDSGISVMTALDVLESYNPTTSTMITMHIFKGSKHSDLIALCTELQGRLSFTAEALREAEQRLEHAHGLTSTGEP